MSFKNNACAIRQRYIPTSFLNTLGPGVLFAATSIGVSHLVQSTRAGAAFGLGMFGIIILAHVFKYSAFRAGSSYALATGKSLLFAYRQQGRWALYLYGLVTVSSIFIVLAAVTLITAGLLRVVFELNLNPSIIATGLLTLTAAVLLHGQYQWLETLTKFLMVMLTIITLLTTAIALPKMNWALSGQLLPPQWNMKTILFATALAGWMPTALDASVWQSVWTVERNRSHSPLTRSQAKRDFNVSYVITALLAACFMLIGASIMHGSGATFSATAPGFAAQFIHIYAVALGEWSRPVTGIAALAVMLSTMITVADGFPRASAKWVMIIQQMRLPTSQQQEDHHREQQWYIKLLLLQCGGALCIIYFWLSSFKLLIDIATTVSFLSAPVLAVLNHRAMNSEQVAASYRLSGAAQMLSLVSIAVLSVFSLVCVWILFRI